jgi:hypothetical protein
VYEVHISSYTSSLCVPVAPLQTVDESKNKQKNRYRYIALHFEYYSRNIYIH